MTTNKHRARLWDPATQTRLELGYYATVEERDLALAQAKLELSQDRVPRVIEDRARGGELFVTFAERTLLDRKRTVADATWRNYQGMLRKWVVPTFGNMKLRDIRSRDVDRWFNEVLPAGSPSNAQRYSVLSLVMARAVRQEEIDRNPCLVEGVSASKSKRRPTWDKNHFHILHDAAATDQERALLWVLFASGCRIGEALALNVEDIDLQHSEIRVAHHMVRSERAEGTKAHPDQVRQLAIVPQAAEALQRHLDGSRRALDEPAFVHSRGGRLGYDRARKTFQSIRESRGLEDFTLHDLRHLSLTVYGQTGATVRDLMERGGHSDMRTALRYQHTSRERDRALVQKMAEMIS